MGMMQVRKRSFVGGILVISVVVLFSVSSFAASAPRLNLFPRDVTEHLSNTGNAAKAMENNLKDVIKGLDTQMKLHKASGCDGSTDPGCDEIAKQMSGHYQKMLNVLKESLPEMKHSIKATNRGIQKNLRKEIGKKTSPADIQRMLSKSNKPKVFKGRFSLSSRFAKYHSMISSGSQSSLATLAAEIYLDSNEVLKMIDLMEAEMAQQETIIKLGSMYGTITPEMTNTVDAVKSVIFGEEDSENAGLPDTVESETGTFQSPLEMD